MAAMWWLPGGGFQKAVPEQVLAMASMWWRLPECSSLYFKRSKRYKVWLLGIYMVFKTEWLSGGILCLFRINGF